jgi:hypothetical protein
VPPLDVLLLDERDDWANALQVKGIGELGICDAAASITNAIYNATGVRIRDYPATLDKVLVGMDHAVRDRGECQACFHRVRPCRVGPATCNSSVEHRYSLAN